MMIFRKELLSLLTLFLCLNFTFGQALKRYSCIVDRIDLHEMEGNRTLDSTGILLSNYRYHPLSISQFGVLSYYYFKDTGDSIYYKKCVDQIKYFKDTSKVHSLFDGKGMGLPYNYNFWDLKAPWYSGMTQGYAVSYLLRYYDLTQDEEVLPIIEKVAYVLLQNQEDGGTISKTPEGYTWIEEYPNSNRSPQVLNGYINGLIGLKEYCDFHPNDTMAKRIFDETYEGVTNSLHHFDTHMWSYYNRKNRGLSNKYMRYQIYEMKHLYELFGDEIFDNQRRIWSVMANKKYIKSKSKAYKFPNHDLVFPINKISDSLLGRILPSPLEVHKEDQLYSSTLQLSNREKRKMKRKMKTECLFTPHTESLKTANYLEIHHSTFNAQSNLAIYHRNAKNKLVPLATEIIATKGKIKISFALTEVSDLVIGLQGFNLSDSNIIEYDFFNTTLEKAPFYLFHKSGMMELKKHTNYKVELKTLNTSKATVFYKTGKSKKDLLLSKWDARNTVSENFEVKENSFYEFLVVFDYESPLSCIEMFEVSEAAKNLD